MPFLHHLRPFYFFQLFIFFSVNSFHLSDSIIAGQWFNSKWIRTDRLYFFLCHLLSSLNFYRNLLQFQFENVYIANPRFYFSSCFTKKELPNVSFLRQQLAAVSEEQIDGRDDGFYDDEEDSEDEDDDPNASQLGPFVQGLQRGPFGVTTAVVGAVSGKKQMPKRVAKTKAILDSRGSAQWSRK